ncbi:MAG: DUF4364 family protein [Ruminococcaceae bacterium]|nr:DUF4364 family protein [Oscillospiraceae bacterium]
MYESPKITIDEKLTIQIYLCFILEQLGELTEDQLSDIVTEIDAVSGLEFFEALSVSVEKELIGVKEEKNVKRLSLLPQGLTMSKEFFHRIPLSIREKTIEYGQYVLKMADLERSIICRIERNGVGEPCYLRVRFLNEINGDELMNLKIYAPDYEQAKLMRERFYEKPSDIVTKIMKMFIKDSYL